MMRLLRIFDVVRNSSTIKRLSRWRDEKATYAAIAAGTLFPFRTCGQCGNYEPLVSACLYAGKTSWGASCDFWMEADDDA